MIRRSPCEYYLKFLILQPGQSDGQIKELLRAQQLDYISGQYMGKLRAQCKPPTPFFPRDNKHSPSREFLIKQGVLDLFMEPPDVKLALRALRSPRAKEFIEAMTLSGAPARAIAIALTSQTRQKYTAEGVEAYQRYFWNIDLIDSTEMKTLLMCRAEGLENDPDPELQKQSKAWKRASYTDPRRTAAMLPHSPISAMLSQMRMGAMPNVDELPKLVELTRLVAVARAYESSVYGGPEDSGNAMNYAIVAEKMTNIQEQIAKPDEDLREQLNKIGLRTNLPDAVPVIHQLSDGRHTVDLMPGEQDVEPAPQPPPEGSR